MKLTKTDAWACGCCGKSWSEDFSESREHEIACFAKAIGDEYTVLVAQGPHYCIGQIESHLDAGNVARARLILGALGYIVTLHAQAKSRRDVERELEAVAR